MTLIYMSQNKYEAKLRKIKQSNDSRERKRKLREEKMKYFPKIKKPSTSKLFLWVTLFLFIEIIFFCEYLAIKTLDTSPLVTLIGTIAGIFSMFHTYSKKSTVENSSGGIIFETAMLAQNKNIISNGSGNENLSNEAVG